MKLTFVNYGSDRCGGNRVLYEVVNGLIDRGHEVEYLALAPQNWFPLKTAIKVCKDPQDLAAKIPESDVVVATWCATAYIVDQVKGLKGVPAYYCQHYEPIFFFTPEEKEFVRKTYDLNLNLVANSPWLKDQLREKHNRESTLVVPGVDSKVFCSKDRKEPGEVFKVLAFASQTPFKGFYDTVLPAFNFVHRALGAKVEFHIYGGADMEVPYDWGKVVVRHKGPSDMQLAEVYRECDLFVSGSWAESSPLPHLEAMACGTPVVCTGVGNEHYGEALVRVPPRAPRLLGQTIIEVLQNSALRASMASLGVVTAKDFPWSKTVDGAEAFFKGIIGE